MTSAPTTGHPRLLELIDVWREAARSLVALLDELAPDDWSRPTDLPGWDVKAVASHCAAIESGLIGRPEPRVDIGSPEHVRNPLGRSTEAGVLNRRDHSPEQITEELRSAVEERYAALVADPPTDPSAPAPGAFARLGWDTLTLFMNRPLDLWMHEQDIRRAVARPGNLHGPAADHVTAYLSGSLGYVLVKKAGGQPGDSVVLEIDGSPVPVVVGEDGRGRPLPEPPAEPTVLLRTDRESFIRLAGGRGTVPAGAVAVEGDPDLGARIVAHLAVTP